MPLEQLQNGRYRILRPLGSGSMGEVYLVEDTRINRQVAIKVMRLEDSTYPNDGTTQEAARLFDREAKSIAKLNHPNILPLFDYGEEVVNGTPLTYMVMPFSPEGSLADWLKQRKNADMLSPEEAKHFLRQAADVLQHAHDHGIIHQDVKPQNFLIRSKNSGLPDLLLADFGIAKLAASTSNASQVIRGTPIYMAPEQWEGHPVPATDQYALAVMIYQLLTGRSPFLGGPSQMMYQHINTPPPPPSTINPALNQDIDTALLRALAKGPEGRFASVSDFAHAFEQALLTPMSSRTNTQHKPVGAPIRATLAISTAEALSGTSRTLTLPDGRRVTVAVPPSTQNGQVIRVKDQDTLPNGEPALPLLLTIAVVSSVEDNPTLHLTDAMTSDHGKSAERAAIGSNALFLPGDDMPTMQSEVPTQLYNNSLAASHEYTPTPQSRMAAPVQRKSSIGRTLLILALVLLIIAGSGGLIYYFAVATPASNSTANATTTAQANSATTLANNETATAQTNATGTARVNTTTTAIAQATQNQANANATATVNTQNQAIAAANATATANAQANIHATATANAVVNATATALAQPLQVVGIDMAVDPTSIAGQTCGTTITVTYTATFHVTDSSLGGTVQFMYSVNNGQSNQDASITFAARETTKTYVFTWTGSLPADHTYPGKGIIVTTSPNSITSSTAVPAGQCT